MLNLTLALAMGRERRQTMRTEKMSASGKIVVVGMLMLGLLVVACGGEEAWDEVDAVTGAVKCAPTSNCGGTSGGPTPGDVGSGCTSDDDCASDLFCDRDVCGDEARGVCTVKPTFCPFFVKMLAPVCGCDGVTYKTDCFRLQAGVSLAHDGAC